MNLTILLPLLRSIHGATFATLDTETTKNNLRKISKGERVIIFRTKGGSGYEGMINRRLAEAGFMPNFEVGPLPWGTRVEDLPLIENNGKYYLQCISLNKPTPKYFLPGGVPCENPEVFGVKARPTNPNLPTDKQVVVNCYNIENIQRMSLLGQEVFDEKTLVTPKRKILKPNYEKRVT